jgi:hypothetical protein
LGAIVFRTVTKKLFVIINSDSPDLCITGLTCSVVGLEAVIIKFTRGMVAWTAEEGDRTLYHVTIAGPDSHGVLADERKVEKYVAQLVV